MAELPKLGMHADVYKHKGGGLYRVLSASIYNSTNKDNYERMVLYVSLKNGQQFVRSYDEFHEMVEWPDGQTRPRFSNTSWLPSKHFELVET